MSSDLLTVFVPLTIVIAAGDVLVLYAGYLSFSVRRGMAVPIFRSRALWMGALALVFLPGVTVGNHVDSLVPQSYLPVIQILSNILVFPAVILVIVAWADRTIESIIRLDFQRRDLIRWKISRPVYWSVIALQFVFYVGISPLVPNIQSLGTDTLNLLGDIYLLLFLFIFLYPAVVLVVGRSRTFDNTFKAHIKWASFFFGSLAIFGVWYQFVPNPVIGSLPVLLTCYCLYEMAKHLVPSERMAPASIRLSM